LRTASGRPVRSGLWKRLFNEASRDFVAYPEILGLVESRLRPGALIVADNADHSPEYLARVRSPENGYMSVAFAADVELSMRIAPSS
jgi:hypothetical protein